jgi:hypothetical protein
MAGLLLCVMGCTPLMGCLFPQDDQQVIGDLPPRRNSPLKIVSQDPQDPRTTFYNTTACPSANPSFKLIVEDEDLGDVVNSLWFIGKTTTQPFQPSPVSGGAQRRSVAAPSSLGFKSALANLPAGTQVLTVYVADTAFQETVDGQIALVAREPKTLPDGSTAVDKGSYDSFTWTLDVEPCQ